MKSNLKMSDADRAYMTAFYKEYSAYMYFLAGKFLSDRSDREDLVHEALLRLMKNTQKLRHMEHNAIAGYLYMTIRSVFIDRWRTAPKEQGMDDVLLQTLFCESLEEAYLTKSEFEHLRGKLSEREWLLLAAKYLYGCSDREISGMVGCAVSSVRGLLSRARKSARKILGGDEN